MDLDVRHLAQDLENDFDRNLKTVTGPLYPGAMFDPLAHHDKRIHQEKLAAFNERLRHEEHRRNQMIDREERQRDMGLGYLVYAARRSKNWSQGVLARRAGLSPGMISRFERGHRRPTLDSLQRIATSCDLQVVLGLRSERDGFMVVGTMFEEGPLTELILFTDKYISDYLPPTPWREKYGF